MHRDSPHGNVLLLVEEAEAGESLGRAVAAVGERPWVVKADARPFLGGHDASSVDLVVTDISTDEDDNRSLLKRLLAGELFPAAPRIHLYRNPSVREVLSAAGPDAASLAMPFPPDEADFKLRVRLLTEIGRLRRGIAAAQSHDAMTGVLNRRHLLERLDEEYARAHRHQTSLSLVVFDVDQLGRINEAFGQTTGDSVLKQFAEIARSQVRKEDLLGRLSGATLAVVMPANGYRGAATFANKVRTEAEDIVLQVLDQMCQVHISAGITTYPDCAHATTAQVLLRSAEAALGEAKARGGNRVFIDEEVLRHERRIVLVADPDPDLLDLAEDLLTLDDYQVVRADCARTALETLRFRRPDLLVIDLHMAEKDGGTLLIEQIHALFPAADFPIIGLSRDPRTPSKQLAKLGVDRFITKPFSVSLLRGAAKDLLGEARTSP